jgi:O-antigen ligase
MAATFESFSSVKSVLVGHGIKTNSGIIDDFLDISQWGLEESMASATVHNVYIELLSDVGLVGLSLFLVALAYVGFHILRFKGLYSSYSLAFLVFVLSYMFEANYVSFFFQFFMMFFLFVAVDAKRGPVHA